MTAQIATPEIDLDHLFAVAGNRSSATAKRVLLPSRRHWTEAEEKFIWENIGTMSDDEIAAALGRSTEALHIHIVRHMPGAKARRRDGWLTGRQVADVLAVDSHKVSFWIDNGIMPGELMPTDRRIRRMRIVSLYVWALATRNWVFFDWRRVTDPKLRRLLELKAERWGDEWWTTNQVAEYHGVDNTDVVRYIKHGIIEAVQLGALNGRPQNAVYGWALWRVLRSEATRPDLVFVKKGKGLTYTRENMWPASLDDFILNATAAGISHYAIAHLTGYERYQVSHRISVFRKAADIEERCARIGAECVVSRHDDNTLRFYKDWRTAGIGYQVTAIRRLVAMLRSGRHVLSKLDRSVVRSTLENYVATHPTVPSQRKTLRTLRRGTITIGEIIDVCRMMLKAGHDPFGIGTFDEPEAHDLSATPTSKGKLPDRRKWIGQILHLHLGVQAASDLLALMKKLDTEKPAVAIQAALAHAVKTMNPTNDNKEITNK